MSPLEPEVPPVGEEIHLPAPSILPVLTAIGITLALVGATTYLVLTIAGGLLTLACIVRWIRDARRDIDELPLDAHVDG
jgi:TRAP-type C4-dicarboxylate transport system permease small subunit